MPTLQYAKYALLAGAALSLTACGALEAMVAIEMMRLEWFHGTANLNNVDPDCGDLDYIVGQGREIKTDYVLSNNFAFGGINTSLIFRKT